MSMKNKISDYITFPTTFENYAWYKPLIVIIITFFIMLILGGAIIMVTYLVGGVDLARTVMSGTYEGLNSALPIIISDLILIMFIPSLYLASKIVNDRPFSSYSSSRGGWNFKLYFKALIIPLIMYIVYQGIDSALTGAKGTSQISIMFLIAICIFVPLQSIAEEFMFRGVLLQTFGSWFKIPVLAIVIQAIIFALFHGYNSFGLFGILVMGLIYGFFAWKTNGIEVSSAIHTANNFTVGLFVMLGLHASTSTPQLGSVVGTIIFEIILSIVLYLVGKKTNWFGEIPESS